jgi:hypothetical protein
MGLILRRNQHRTDPTPHPLAAFVVRMKEWCAPIPQALPVWDRVPQLQQTLHNPRLPIPPEIRREYPEFPRVARVLKLWSPVEPPRALRNRSFDVLLFSEAYCVRNQLNLLRCNEYKVSFEARVNLLRCR